MSKAAENPPALGPCSHLVRPRINRPFHFAYPSGAGSSSKATRVLGSLIVLGGLPNVAARLDPPIDGSEKLLHVETRGRAAY